MRKIGILLGIAMLLGGTASIKAQDRAIKNGFGMNLILGLPASSYGLDIDDTDTEPDETQIGLIFGFQVGNRWYFAPTDKFGVGLMVNWLDLTWGGKKADIVSAEVVRGVVDLSLFEFGPVGTIALSDDMALDAYYNLRPTVIMSAYTRTTASTTLASVTAGLGISHAIGGAFRFKVLNVGLEYVMGGVSGATTGEIDGTSTDIDIPKIKVNTGSLRFSLGLKF